MTDQPPTYDAEAHTAEGDEPRSFTEALLVFCNRHVKKIFPAGMIVAFFLVVLIPASISTLEFHQYGLKMRKSTGTVDTTQVYTGGRYVNGPDYDFKKYPADTQRIDYKALTVYSSDPSNSSVGLEFHVDITMTYLLIGDEIGQLHEELASGYATVIESRSKAAIKNAAADIPYNEYFQERDRVEGILSASVRARLLQAPSLHANLDHLILGRVQIPDTVAQKQLDVKVQVERNSEETNKKAASLERSATEVARNKVLLQAQYELRVAEAAAHLTREQGKALAKDVVETAQAEGYADLLDECGITQEKHILSYDYLRTLRARVADDESSDTLSVSYLSDNVLHTQAASA